jgi:hypothetical protein
MEGKFICFVLRDRLFEDSAPTVLHLIANFFRPLTVPPQN